MFEVWTISRDEPQFSAGEVQEAIAAKIRKIIVEAVVPQWYLGVEIAF